MITVMTFNIRYAGARDGANRWSQRRGLVIERIRAAAPDLLGLQECRDGGQAAYVRQRLPEYEFYGVPRGGDGPTALEMAPILWRRSAFRLRRRGVFWLSETPRAPGSTGWDAMFPRTATWAELTHRPSGRSFLFLTTHLDLRPAAIDGAARLLRRQVARVAARGAAVVCGDFNADKTSAAYHMLAGGRPLVDAGRLGGADGGTFHGFGGAAAAPIDWILVSPSLAVSGASIDRTRHGDLFPSDHYPLVVTLA